MKDLRHWSRTEHRFIEPSLPDMIEITRSIPTIQEIAVVKVFDFNPQVDGKNACGLPYKSR